jgi:hypothetical protein
MIPTGLLGLLMRPAGPTRQVSSNDRDLLRGSQVAGLRPAAALQKRVLLEPGEEHIMADLTGPGLITRLWMTSLPLTRRALRGLALRFYWDGEPGPSVEAPLGDFFGSPFGRYTPYVSMPLAVTGGGLNSYWPMPFAQSARLAVANEGRRAVDPLYFQVTYTQLESPLETELRFHALWRRENPPRTGRPYTILEAHGSGHYAGCHLSLQTREWWLRPPWREIVFPRAFGIGMLEGRMSFFVDGEDEPSIRGTGTEDDFGGGLYYLPGGRFSGPFHGCTVRDYLRGRFAVYRFDAENPVPFERSLRVTIDHGIQNERAADYASVAYWYQEEPHTPQGSALPAAGPASSALNVAQMALVLGLPLLAAGGTLAGLRRLIRRITDSPIR